MSIDLQKLVTDYKQNPVDKETEFVESVERVARCMAFNKFGAAFKRLNASEVQAARSIAAYVVTKVALYLRSHEAPHYFGAFLATSVNHAWCDEVRRLTAERDIQELERPLEEFLNDEAYYPAELEPDMDDDDVLRDELAQDMDDLGARHGDLGLPAYYKEPPTESKAGRQTEQQRTFEPRHARHRYRVPVSQLPRLPRMPNVKIAEFMAGLYKDLTFGYSFDECARLRGVKTATLRKRLKRCQEGISKK